MSSARGFFHRISAYLRTAKHEILHRLRRTDLQRWKDFSFPHEWEQRSARIALLTPAGSRVYEFGAGESNLQSYLPSDCTLVSSDVVQRTPETFIVDLNRRPLPKIDGPEPRIAVFGGVLEYISDVPGVVSWIHQNFELCIASYECAEAPSSMLDRIRQRLRRTHEGWVNHYTRERFGQLFASQGFRLKQTESWGKLEPGLIFVFEREPDRRATQTVETN